MCTMCDARRDGFNEFNVDFDSLYINDLTVIENFSGAGSGGGAAANGKPNVTIADAAETISRRDIKWDDGNYSTGDTVNGSYDPTALGTAGTMTYGYLSSTGVAGVDGVVAANVALGAAEQVNVERAIAMWESIANIDFVRVGTQINSSSDADIAIMGESGTNGGSTKFAYYPSVGASDSGRIAWALVDTGTSGLSTFGDYAYLTAMHELGHAIGLSHPGEYDGGGFSYSQSAEYYQDTVQYSLMSYWGEENSGAAYGANRHPTSAMLHDVAAIQRLYGVNTTTFSGNTTFGFNSNTDDLTWDLEQGVDYMIGAIWDVGGYDTLNFSGFSMDQIIYLEEEVFSSTGGLTSNVAVASGVKIEAAIGGDGDDLIVGNDADGSHIDAAYLTNNGSAGPGAPVGFDGANVLVGNGGDDTLLGGGGDDVLRPGTGNNTVDGEDGYDVLDLSDLSGGITVEMGAGDLVITIGVDSVNVQNTEGFDFGTNAVTLFGGDGADVFASSDQADSLMGEGGDDELYGMDGDDVIMGGDGNDLLIGDGESLEGLAYLLGSI